MCGLAVCRLGDLDAPLHRSLFQRGPVEGAVVGQNARLSLFTQIGERYGVSLASVPAAGNALRHVKAAGTAGCPTHLLLTGQSEHLRGRVGLGSDADLAALAPDLPPGTRTHDDLGAFADWLLAQPST